MVVRDGSLEAAVIPSAALVAVGSRCDAHGWEAVYHPEQPRQRGEVPGEVHKAVSYQHVGRLHPGDGFVEERTTTQGLILTQDQELLAAGRLGVVLPQQEDDGEAVLLPEAVHHARHSVLVPPPGWKDHTQDLSERRGGVALELREGGAVEVLGADEGRRPEVLLVHARIQDRGDQVQLGGPLAVMWIFVWGQKERKGVMWIKEYSVTLFLHRNPTSAIVKLTD